MLKHLPVVCLAIMLTSCVSTVNRSGSETKRPVENRALPAVTTSFADVDTTLIMPSDLSAGMSPISLMELPRTENGAFVLAPGLYEADFKSFCLQPGTPGPSSKDVYFQAPLEGGRKDMIQSILVHYRNEPRLEQKNVQLLLWAVVSHTDFNKLSPDVQYTARQLLTQRQVFELQGGVLGVVKTVAGTLPSSGRARDIKQLFDLGVQSYEAYERLAVANVPSSVHRSDLTRDRWYRQPEGYYVRYLPDNYKQTKIQVFVPNEPADTGSADQEQYVVFDPVSLVVVPANSNAQRLGIGGPVVDIVKSVIRIEAGKAPPRPKVPSSKPATAPVKTLP